MNRCVARVLALTSVALAVTSGTAFAVTPAKVQSRLSLPGAFTVSRQSVSTVGRAVGVQGVVRPYIVGESVTVTARLGPRVLMTRRLAVRRSPGGTYGWYTLQVASPATGTVTVTVVHRASARLGAFRTQTHYAALSDTVGFGARGLFVELMQARLADLGFYLPRTGVYDVGTALALDAYHRLLRSGAAQTLDHRTAVWLLNGWGAFPVRYPGDGRHAEGNLGLQLLALIDRGRVEAIYPISSGKPSTPTILGRYRVYQKTPGYLPDGMYYSSFFTGGYAIHGYNPAPDFPASHGCMRVPIPDAVPIYAWLRMGDRVDVYP